MSQVGNNEGEIKGLIFHRTNGHKTAVISKFLNLYLFSHLLLAVTSSQRKKVDLLFKCLYFSQSKKTRTH